MRWFLLALLLPLVSCAPLRVTRYHNLSPSEIKGTVHVFTDEGLYPDARKQWISSMIYTELEKVGYQRTGNLHKSDWVVIFASGVKYAGDTGVIDVRETSPGNYRASTTDLYVHKLLVSLHENDPSKPPRWKASALTVKRYASEDAALPALIRASFKDYPGISGQRIANN